MEHTGEYRSGEPTSGLCDTSGDCQEADGESDSLEELKVRPLSRTHPRLLNFHFSPLLPSSQILTALPRLTPHPDRKHDQVNSYVRASTLKLTRLRANTADKSLLVWGAH